MKIDLLLKPDDPRATLPIVKFDAAKVRATLRRRLQLRHIPTVQVEQKTLELLEKYGGPEIKGQGPPQRYSRLHRVVEFVDHCIAAAWAEPAKVEQFLLFKEYLQKNDMFRLLPLPDPETLAALPTACIRDAASAYIHETYTAPEQVPVFEAMLQGEIPFDPLIWEYAERSLSEVGTLEPNGQGGYHQHLPPKAEH